MKKKIFLLLIASTVLSSCGSIDAKHRYIYLAAKYKLKFAGYNDSYNVSTMPPYFKQIQVENCINLFDTENSIICYNVEVNNGVPHGFGYLDLKLNAPYNTNYHYDFDYRVLYDKTYGGEVVYLNNTGPEIIGKQYCRNRYWFVRMEMFLPEVNNKRIIAEFNVCEELPEPTEFNTNIVSED